VSHTKASPCLLHISCSTQLVYPGSVCAWHIPCSLPHCNAKPHASKREKPGKAHQWLPTEDMQCICLDVALGRVGCRDQTKCNRTASSKDVIRTCRAARICGRCGQRKACRAGCWCCLDHAGAGQAPHGQPSIWERPILTAPDGRLQSHGKPPDRDQLAQS